MTLRNELILKNNPTLNEVLIALKKVMSYRNLVLDIKELDNTASNYHSNRILCEILHFLEHSEGQLSSIVDDLKKYIGSREHAKDGDVHYCFFIIKSIFLSQKNLTNAFEISEMLTLLFFHAGEIVEYLHCQLDEFFILNEIHHKQDVLKQKMKELIETMDAHYEKNTGSGLGEKFHKVGKIFYHGVMGENSIHGHKYPAEMMICFGRAIKNLDEDDKNHSPILTDIYLLMASYVGNCQTNSGSVLSYNKNKLIFYAKKALQCSHGLDGASMAFPGNFKLLSEKVEEFGEHGLSKQLSDRAEFLSFPHHKTNIKPKKLTGLRALVKLNDKKEIQKSSSEIKKSKKESKIELKNEKKQHGDSVAIFVAVHAIQSSYMMSLDDSKDKIKSKLDEMKSKIETNEFLITGADKLKDDIHKLSVQFDSLVRVVGEKFKATEDEKETHSIFNQGKMDIQNLQAKQNILWTEVEDSIKNGKIEADRKADEQRIQQQKYMEERQQAELEERKKAEAESKKADEEYEKSKKNNLTITVSPIKHTGLFNKKEEKTSQVNMYSEFNFLQKDLDAVLASLRLLSEKGKEVDCILFDRQIKCMSTTIARLAILYPDVTFPNEAARGIIVSTFENVIYGLVTLWKNLPCKHEYRTAILQLSDRIENDLLKLLVVDPIRSYGP